ncbi:hypothetical protein [Bernardetia sp.]|uniref:hypothetical protein n=1 Tax=Bernardetia sp. TaxID=1937974 RepID=UPI0025B898D4|nr:hypothetical protein [Bernardetia sp.]
MKSKYVKRTQKDYTMQLKLQIICEIKEGIFTVTQAQRNYDIESCAMVIRKYQN